MLMGRHLTSELIDDHVPALSARQSQFRRIAYKRWLLVVRYFLVCQEVARQRRHLLTLDQRQLKDFGTNRADALREADRHFWDLPEYLKARR